MTQILDAPQEVQDGIVDRLIEVLPCRDGFRWVNGLDACRLDWRHRDGLCPCGVEIGEETRRG